MNVCHVQFQFQSIHNLDRVLRYLQETFFDFVHNTNSKQSRMSCLLCVNHDKWRLLTLRTMEYTAHYNGQPSVW